MAGARWTEQDEQNYREWAESRPYAPPSDIELEPLPLWQHAAIIIGAIVFCGVIWGSVLYWISRLIRP